MWFQDRTRWIIGGVDWSIGIPGKGGLIREYLVTVYSDRGCTICLPPETRLLTYMGKSDSDITVYLPAVFRGVGED